MPIIKNKGFFRFLSVFFIIVVCHLLAVASDAPRGPEIVNSVIENIITTAGGKQVIEKITALHAVGDITALMRQDKGTYEVFFKRPDKMRVETKYRRSFETRILNGTSGYRGTENVPLTPVNDHRLLAMVYQCKHTDLLYGLLHGYYSVIIKGQENLNGREVRLLEVTDAQGRAMDVYVDTVTFYIVKVTGYFVIPDGRTTSLSSEFFDYRNVGGTLLPFRVVNYAGGQKIAETTIRSYDLNPALPDSLFDVIAPK